MACSANLIGLSDTACCLIPGMTPVNQANMKGFPRTDNLTSPPEGCKGKPAQFLEAGLRLLSSPEEK